MIVLSLTIPAHFVWQLTVGLYEFNVIVDGDNAHGEGMVNVTVKPGMLSHCINLLLSCIVFPGIILIVSCLRNHLKNK